MLIYTKLEQYHYAEAAAIAVVTLGASFAVLLFINLIAMVEPAVCGVRGIRD